MKSKLEKKHQTHSKEVSKIKLTQAFVIDLCFYSPLRSYQYGARSIHTYGEWMVLSQRCGLALQYDFLSIMSLLPPHPPLVLQCIHLSFYILPILYQPFTV